MEPKSPEFPTPPKNITLLTKTRTEGLESVREVAIRADNIGAQEWAQMLSETQSDGKERGLIIYLKHFSKDKFETSRIIIGSNTHTGISFDDMGLRRFLSPAIVTTVHTHPRTPGTQALKTLIPVDDDVRRFFEDNYSAMVTLDDGGAHILIRTGESMFQNPPPEDLISNLIKAEAAGEGLVANVQKRINNALSPYGLSYFYSESLIPAENGTFTFKKP